MMNFKSAVITDRGEAFSHNSCKKLAQLSKVLFTMTSEMQDRNDQLRQIDAEMEDSIAELIDEHDKYLNIISNNIINIRKTYINEACDEYGAIYKDKKAELQNMVAMQSQKLETLRSEFRKLGRIVNKITMNSLRTAADVIDSAQEVKTSIQEAVLSSKIPESVLETVQKLNDQVVAMEQESNKRIEDMRRENRKEFEKCKQTLVKHVITLISQRKPAFMEIRNNLAAYESDVTEFRSNYQKVVEERTQFLPNFCRIRDTIISDTNRVVGLIKSEIKSIKDKAEINRMGFEALRASMLKHKTARELEFKRSERALKKEAHNMKKQRHESSRNRESDAKQREDELGRQEMNQKEKLNRKFIERRNAIDWVQSKVQEASDDTAAVIRHLQSLINQSVRNVSVWSIQFKNSLEEQEVECMKHLEKLKSEYLSERESEIRKINAEMEIVPEMRENDEIASLRNMLETVYVDTEKRIAEANTSFDLEMKEVCSRFLAENASKIESCREKIDKKTTDLRKTLLSIRQRLQKELDDKANAVRNENAVKLTAEIDKYMQVKCDTNDEMHTTISQLKVRLGLIEKSIATHKTMRKKQLEKLDNQIVSLDKQKRKFERSRKAEIQSIDENYEMKIQIEQVSLREKIENIAKLYTEEENMQGKELIEAIRKVKETENRRLNMCVDKTRALEETKKDFASQRDSLCHEIQEYSSNHPERTIEEKILKIMNETRTAIVAIQSDSKQASGKMKTRIDSDKEALIGEKKLILNQVAQENADFEAKRQAFASEKQKVTEEKTSALAKIAKEFEAQKAAMILKHQRVVENMKARIASAESVQNEYTQKTESIRTKIIQNFEKEASQKMEEATESVRTKAHKMIADMDKRLDDARTRLQDAKARAFVFHVKNDIDSLETKQRFAKLVDRDNHIAKLFEQHRTKVIEIASKDYQTVDSPVRRSLMSISSEGNFKKSPLLITPQILF